MDGRRLLRPAPLCRAACRIAARARDLLVRRATESFRTTRRLPGVLQSLAAEGCTASISLRSIAATRPRWFARSIRALDGARIHAESGGNPLFVVELARARGRGETGSTTIDAIVTGQLARLSEPTRDALTWAAAYGRSFKPEDLARLASSMRQRTGLGVRRAGAARPAAPFRRRRIRLQPRSGAAECLSQYLAAAAQAAAPACSGSLEHDHE